jgi:hypothetical protein
MLGQPPSKMVSWLHLVQWNSSSQRANVEMSAAKKIFSLGVCRLSLEESKSEILNLLH